ncbi:MAG TPA: S41 family peptidase [Chitinophagaceae bacterium]|nr:S41 family peptidase [Chitinophagaceae bacterium]
MNKLSLTAILFLLPVYLWAQTCDCLAQFSFVKGHYEKNNPAFQKIKNDTKAYRQYAAEVQALDKPIRKETSSERCIVWLEKYVALLKDHHSGININLKRLQLDFNSPSVIDSFRKTDAYRSFKIIKVDSTELYSQLASKSSSDIEGIYTNGGSITFGVVQNKKNHYSAIVLKKSKLLDVGHILMELETTKSPSVFKSIYNIGLSGFNFQKIYKTVEVKNGKMAEYGFYKPGIQPEEEQGVFSFKEIDTQTNYLKLTSFTYPLKDKLNAFYKTIDSTITSKPYLIIDLRNNGGGSEECYFNLLPYVYTQPFKIDDVELWVSPENIKQYENFQNKNIELISRMKSATPFSFIPQVENGASEWKMESTTNPKKVAILFNRYTASSAESMITYCIQSSKVVTLGENSGGYLGYGNVMTTVTPCGNLSLNSTTTKYKNNSRYEFIGIKPMVKLNAQSNWIEAARKALQ